MRSAGSQMGAGMGSGRGSGRGSKARSKRGSSGRSGRSGRASTRGSSRGSLRGSVRGVGAAAGGAAAGGAEVSPASALGRRVCRGRLGRSPSVLPAVAGAGEGEAVAPVSSDLAARLRGARFTGASRYGLSSPAGSGAGRVRGRRVGFGSVIRLLRVGQTACDRSDTRSASSCVVRHEGAARPGLWPRDAGTGTAQGGANAQNALVRVLGGRKRSAVSLPATRLRVAGTAGGNTRRAILRSLDGPRGALPGRAPNGAPQRYIYLRGAVSIAPPDASRNPRLLPRRYRKGFCGREFPSHSAPDRLALWA